MSTALTYYFNEIFTSYYDWKDFSYSLGLFDPQSAADAPYRAFDQFCYNVLARYFINQNVRYTEVNTFLCKLANVYVDRFKQFYNQKEAIDALYGLTADDYAIVNNYLNNMANNPNELPSDPLKPLEFISAQRYGQVTSNRLKAYLDAINGMPSLRINEFIKGRREYADEMAFTDLFMNVQPVMYGIYPKEIEE